MGVVRRLLRLGPIATDSMFCSFLKSIATFTGDLSTLTAPSFILSGTSILEYSSYWGEHPDLFCDIIKAENPETRMLAVVKWCMNWNGSKENSC